MYNPKISVLMSIYNNEKTVDASIRSIVEQTFKDWELILIDDASTDGSLQRLEHWRQQDNRIQLFSNSENMGLAASLNKAFEKSAGAYVARMDGDDISFPDRLQKQLEFMETHPQYAVLSAACVLFDEQGHWGQRINKPEPNKKDFLWGSQFLHPACMIRREALLKAGGYRVSRETLRTEDYDLFMRLYALGYLGYNLSEPLLYYYENRKPRRVKFAQRLCEAKTRSRGFKALGLMPKGFLYTLKPLAVGLIPGKLKRKLQRISKAPEGGA